MHRTTYATFKLKFEKIKKFIPKFISSSQIKKFIFLEMELSSSKIKKVLIFPKMEPHIFLYFWKELSELER